MKKIFIEMIVGVIITSMVTLGGFFLGKDFWIKRGYAKGWEEKPQQVLTAPSTIVNEAPPSGYWYGIQGGKSWGVGICHR